MTTIREVLADVERDIDVAEAQYRAAKGRYEECQAISDGLRLAIEKYDLGLDDEVDASLITG